MNLFVFSTHYILIHDNEESLKIQCVCLFLIANYVIRILRDETANIDGMGHVLDAS